MKFTNRLIKTKTEMLVANLTPEQNVRLGEIEEQFRQYGLATGACNRSMCEKLLKQVYRNGIPSIRPPKKFIWVDSPLAGAKLAQQLRQEAGEKATVDDALECGFGQHDANWLAYYYFLATELKTKASKRVLPLTELCKHCGWWWPFDNVCIISERPTKMLLDAKNQLHCDDGPAILYPDGFAVYAKHGKVYTPSRRRKIS